MWVLAGWREKGVREERRGFPVIGTLKVTKILKTQIVPDSEPVIFTK